jgi:putative peptide zinc metalloprotease protein
MLCRRCRRLLVPGAATCGWCGKPVFEGPLPLELVLPDGKLVPIYGSLKVGRAPDNDLRIDDPTVSRNHARVWQGADGAEIEDVGSTHGTFLDGRKVAAPEPLADGSEIALGDVRLRVETRRLEEEAGRTILVRVGSTVVVPAVGESEVELAGTSFGFRPRVRSGWALKRLAADEGERRWVLKDLKTGGFLRMADDEAELFRLIDGRRGLPELVAEAERRFDAEGTARLAALLADLAEHGLLEGTDAPEASDDTAPLGRLARLLRPRVHTFDGAGSGFQRAYELGGWVLLTRTALAVLSGIAIVGAAAFAYLVLGRYGTPFVVAQKVGLGGLVFLIGRFLVVALHESAHGLLLTGYGRGVARAGFKVLLFFPYAFVDTSDAWFEPRQRRVWVSAAGPASDLAAGGAFSLAAAFSGAGTLRDIFFQLAFAAYLGALFNLNPFLDRDGYNMLVDALGEPGLRGRSREWLAAKLSGRPYERREWVVAAYAGAVLAWSFVAVAFAIVISQRYYDTLEALVPKELLWVLFGLLYVLLFVPVLVSVGRPLVERLRRAPRETSEASGAAG